MRSRTTVLVAMMSGFIALSYEILWYRAFAFVGLSRPITFGALLGVYLFGVALGADRSRKYCVTATSDEEGRSRYLRVIAAFVGLASIVSFLVIPLLARLSSISFSFTSLQAWPLAFIAVTVAAGMMGAVLPLVAHFGIEADDRAGLKLSYVYLANIIGSTTGSLLTGFVLMEIASTRTISFGLATAGFTMSVLLLIASDTRGKLFVASYIGALACVALAGLASRPLFSELYDRLLFKDEFRHGKRLVHVLENRHGVIVVDDQGMIYGGGVFDGYFNTSLSKNTNRLERPLAVAVVQPHPKEVLVVGLASGSWAQVIVNLPAVEHMTIIEIDEGYLQLIPQYPEVASLLKNPKVTLVIDDGRRWLLRHPERKFDITVMNTTWHWRAHATNLLSREFLQIVRGHLLPGGVHGFNPTGSADAMRTAALNYPFALRFENFMFVSDSPITFDRELWRTTLVNASIDGVLMLDPSRPSDQKAFDKFLAVPDAPRTEWASMEWRDDILAHTKNGREITDDNMASEWDESGGEQ